MLAMDGHQMFTHGTQLLQGCRMTVDKGTGAARGVHNTPQQTVFRFFTLQCVFIQPFQQVGSRFDIKQGADFSALTPLPDLAGIPTFAQNERQRINQYGLPCAGLTGQHRKAGCEFKFHLFNDDKIPDS